MKYIRVIGAIILTVIMLRIARETSRGRPELVIRSTNGITLEMYTATKGPENGTARVSVKVAAANSSDLTPVLRFAEGNSTTASDLARYQSRVMTPFDSAEGVYSIEVNAGTRGDKLLYFVEVTDNTDNIKAQLLQDNGAPFEMKYIGRVPLFVLVTHIGLMFGTVFCVSMAFLYAWRLVGGSADVRPMAILFAFATLFAFIGGYPFGFAMNYYAFNVIWEGVPFGTDATDNKTQILLLFLLFVTASTVGSLTNRRFGRDLFTPKTVGCLGVAAFLLMLGIYLIPHSIQFSPALTYAVCYSFIAALALLYLFSYLRMKRSEA
ncbi:MAG: hypothetical protein AB1644_06815 [Candidatus Zixiibacteriota bacterium]